MIITIPSLQLPIVLGATLTTVILSSILLFLKKRKRIGQGLEVARVSNLVLYPIKSLRGIQLETAEVTNLGLKYGRFRDRQWLIAKDDGSFITQRQQPTLATIKLEILDGELHLTAANQPKLIIKPITVLDVTKKRRCNVYEQEVDGVDCGDEPAHWIQRFLNRTDIRFIQFLPGFEPRKHLRNLYGHPNPGNLMYHDDAALLVLSKASVANLNGRLQEEDKISYKNFRPNILLENCENYAEDYWHYIEIGTTTLIFMEPCTRCILTTINPESGIRNKSEPLKTLKQYRMAKNDEKASSRFSKNNTHSEIAIKSPCFGSFYGTDTPGVVSVGDPVYLM